MLWHVSFASDLSAILREGIVAKEPRRIVFAFTDCADASDYAATMHWTRSNDADMPRLVVIVAFEADPDAWEVLPNRVPDVGRSSVVLRDAVVPPTAIRHVEVLVSALLSR